MRAVTLGTDGRFSVAEAPEPVPGPGEVEVEVTHAGVQWGDVLVRDGHFPVPRPFVPGFEAAGRIGAVGEGVDPGRVGERVVALLTGGGFAEVAVAPAALAVAAGGLDGRTAAASGWTTPTAYDLVGTVARVRPGESVLVHAAAGGVGGQAVQFARLAGAGRIVGVVGGREQAEYAARYGCDRVVTRDAFPAALEGEAFDVVLDPVGGATRRANLTLLAPHGRLVVYGNIATFEPVTVSANDLLGQGQSLLAYNSSLLATTHPARLAGSAALALAEVAAGRVRIDVTAEYALAETGEAVGRLAEGRTRGKSVVRVR
ncbi:zinc-binding alcohol dehydrogenase family protein [Streptomyces sp. NPDC049879]|uniref:zinc-binding alcohol dehydrogenase family protein n=1 Tax=Streptomyces sp. NPDC049879 TaxID=3365598 RepID=UPI0037AC3BAF